MRNLAILTMILTACGPKTDQAVADKISALSTPEAGSPAKTENAKPAIQDAEALEPAPEVAKAQRVPAIAKEAEIGSLSAQDAPAETKPEPKILSTQTCENDADEPVKFKTVVKILNDNSREYLISYGVKQGAILIDNFSTTIKDYPVQVQNPQTDIVAPKTLEGAKAEGNVNADTEQYVYVVRFTYDDAVPTIYASTLKVKQRPDLEFEIAQSHGNKILLPSLKCKTDKAI